MSNKRNIEMGFTPERFPEGTHMCLIYSNEEERRQIIAKFLDGGCKTNERVGYMVDTMSAEEVLNWLKDLGVVVPPEKLNTQFYVTMAEETYCPGKEFVPEKMLDYLKNLYHQSIQDGYQGIRATGEMSWALKGIPGSNRLMEYEALLNYTLDIHPLTAVCQYNANLFDGATILDCLKVHPMMIVHGQVVMNPYYMRPEEFIADFKMRA